MIRTLSLTLALTLVAGPALALSCMRPDAVRMFEYARDSKDIYYVIKGRITPVGTYNVPTSENGKGAFADTAVQISGTGLGAKGFSVPVEIAATVHLSCLSVWCAGPPADDELIMIVKKTDDDLTLDVGPCGGTAIPWTSDAEKRLLQCHLSDKCVPGDF